ncbi:MAG: hypothetical protein MJ232_02800 [archaeon]|nr:hypothetical protein [archaeon]
MQNELTILQKLNDLMYKHNFITTMFYIFVLLGFTFFTLANMRISTLNDRIDLLESEMDTIKNEVVNDYQSYIQLHNNNN